jgi:phosphoribosylformimino-5-aminoimidazole carboxamide ribotide isomerase
MSQFPTFEVVPAVDVQDGEAVQLVQGEKGSGKRYGDPVAAAERWLDEGARTLHLVDLDGAFEGERANADAIAAIVEATERAEESAGGDEAAGIGIQVGGGIRTVDDATSLLDAGVDRVILGTAAIERPAIVEAISADHPEGVMVSLDAKDGEVVVSGWTEGTGLDPADAASRYEELGAGSILFTNVDVEGQLEGIDRAAVERVVDAVDIPVVASGGVTSLSDLRELRAAGAAAVVVGTALYEGRFSLREAMDV